MRRCFRTCWLCVRLVLRFFSSRSHLRRWRNTALALRLSFAAAGCSHCALTQRALTMPTCRLLHSTGLSRVNLSIHFATDSRRLVEGAETLCMF